MHIFMTTMASDPREAGIPSPSRHSGDFAEMLDKAPRAAGLGVMSEEPEVETRAEGEKTDTDEGQVAEEAAKDPSAGDVDAADIEHRDAEFAGTSGESSHGSPSEKLSADREVRAHESKMEPEVPSGAFPAGEGRIKSDGAGSGPDEEGARPPDRGTIAGTDTPDDPEKLDEDWRPIGGDGTHPDEVAVQIPVAAVTSGRGGGADPAPDTAEKGRGEARSRTALEADLPGAFRPLPRGERIMPGGHEVAPEEAGSRSVRTDAEGAMGGLRKLSPERQSEEPGLRALTATAEPPKADGPIRGGLSVARAEFRIETPIPESKPTEAPRPTSLITRNVVERVAQLPGQAGTVTIRLTPHGMGMIEIGIDQDASGRMDVSMRVQNPMVLEAMVTDRATIAHLFTPASGGGQGGTLSMGMMQAGADTEARDGEREGGRDRPGTTSAEDTDENGSTTDTVHPGSGHAADPEKLNIMI